MTPKRRHRDQPHDRNLAQTQGARAETRLIMIEMSRQWADVVEPMAPGHHLRIQGVRQLRHTSPTIASYLPGCLIRLQ
eukprot:1484419-Pyramimonas_sp.AAC.1